jgi:hypothetical protein
MQDKDPGVLEQMRDAAKADLVAASLAEAVKHCVELTEASKSHSLDKDEFAETTAA